MAAAATLTTTVLAKAVTTAARMKEEKREIVALDALGSHSISPEGRQLQEMEMAASATSQIGNENVGFAGQQNNFVLGGVYSSCSRLY